MGLGWSNYLDVSIWVLIPFAINNELALNWKIFFNILFSIEKWTLDMATVEDKTCFLFISLDYMNWRFSI